MAAGCVVAHRPSRKAPGDAFARPERHEAVLTERQLLWNLRFLLFQSDSLRVYRQAIVLRAEAARESLEPIERAGLIEGLCIELDTGVRRVDARAPATRLLGVTRVGRAVGAQK